MLRLKWVTDIHNCKAGDTEKRAARRAKIHEILETLTESSLKSKPALLVNTGDNIDTTQDMPDDFSLQLEVKDRLGPLNGKVMSLPGNHDVRHFGKPELSLRFGMLGGSRLIHDHAASIILWGADTKPHISGCTPKHYIATPDDLAELERLLSHAPSGKPVLLFSHIPLQTDALTRPVDAGEIRNPAASHYQNRGDILDIIDRSGHKIVAFSGHRHINRVMQVTPRLTCITMDRLYRDGYMENRPAGINIADIEIRKKQLRLVRAGASARTVTLTL